MKFVANKNRKTRSLNVKVGRTEEDVRQDSFQLIWDASCKTLQINTPEVEIYNHHRFNLITTVPNLKDGALIWSIELKRGMNIHMTLFVNILDEDGISTIDVEPYEVEFVFTSLAAYFKKMDDLIESTLSEVCSTY